MRALVVAVVSAFLVVGCRSTDIAMDPAWQAGSEPLRVESAASTARLVFVGDVMLGREVAPIAAADPTGLFADVRYIVATADIAFLNLESPLTNRDHVAETPHALEADPEVAQLIAEAGFDVASLANNHSGDAGVAGIRDTVANLAAVGIRAIGVGSDGDAANRPLVIDVGETRIAVLAFDLTWQGPAAGSEPGLAEWDSERVRQAVAAADDIADVTVVSLHGGIEYRTSGEDPIMEPAIEGLAEMGVDVIWGHGAHVVRSIGVEAASGDRSSLAALNLGNFLFDQRAGATGVGAILEVLVDDDGVIAYRVGRTSHGDLRVSFIGWDPPLGNAVAIAGDWWELVRPAEWLEDGHSPDLSKEFPYGDVSDAVAGDLTGDGETEIIVSYRAPFAETLANAGDVDLYADSQGRAAHFGLFEPVSWRKIWAAGTVQRPIAALQPCDAVLGFAYSSLDDPDVVATGAAAWGGFGFSFMPELEGPGELHCADVDRNSSIELVVTR